jgi:mannosyl-oligosaccharide glucosidase
MEWGTYKPNLFFGVKDRAAQPVTVGLAWAVPGNGGFDLRHTYRYQSGDGVTARFEYHDGWSAARQIVEDPLGNVRFEIDFLKQLLSEEGGTLVSQWKALLTLKPLDPQYPMRLVPMLYLSY